MNKIQIFAIVFTVPAMALNLPRKSARSLLQYEKAKESCLQDWCDARSLPWEKKCTWKTTCQGCPNCATICPQWCTDHTLSWETKLKWEGCASCPMPAPNILLIVADDLGYNDLGYRQNKVTDANPHGLNTTSEKGRVFSPTIDKLASESMKLERNYAQSTCTPARVALLTGRYPWRTGMGPIPLVDGMPWGVPGSEKMLAEVLSEAGYATHMVGKWHLGNNDERYTPTFRGFDSFFGLLTGAGDYFEHRTHHEALDFRSTELASKNILTPNTDEFRGKYSTTIMAERVTDVVQYHKNNGGGKPLFLFMAFQNIHGKWVQAPDDVKNKYNGTFFEDEDGIRVQTALAMVTAMDNAVASIEADFKDAGLWDETFVVFTGDNGGNPMAPGKYGAFGTMWPGGSNYPLRGAKATDWEGGVRCTAFIRGTKEWPVPVGETKELTHITDIFATLVHIAGGSTEGIELDGHNIYDVISKGAPATRDNIIFDCPYLDSELQTFEEALNVTGRFGAVRKGDLKLFYQQDGARSSTDSEDQMRQLKHDEDELLCDCPDPIDGIFVFNISEDPRECTNLAGKAEYADQIQEMKDLLSSCSKDAAESLADHFRFIPEMNEIWQEQIANTRVFDPSVGTPSWQQYDCAKDYPGKCGWPMR